MAKNFKNKNINVNSIMSNNFGGTNFKNKNYNNNNYNSFKYKNYLNSKYVPTEQDINYFKVGEDIKGTNMILSEDDLVNAKTIDTFAPLRGFKQITSIVGAAGCGKTTTIKNLIKYYATEYNIKNVAVVSINERDDEIDDWKDLDLKHFYAITSNDLQYEAEAKVEIIKAAIDKINSDNSIDLVVIDSITGWYELIVESGKVNKHNAAGDGGFRFDIFNDIWKVVGNIKSKYKLCSIIQNRRSKTYTVLNDAFNSKANSTIYLESELTYMGVYNNINPYKSFTRKAVYSELRKDAIRLLNAFGGSFKAMIALEAIPEGDYGKDFYYSKD